MNSFGMGSILFFDFEKLTEPRILMAFTVALLGHFKFGGGMGWVLHSIFIDEKGVAPLIPFL
jgi:hypothetical protein